MTTQPMRLDEYETLGCDDAASGRKWAPPEPLDGCIDCDDDHESAMFNLHCPRCLYYMGWINGRGIR